MRGGKGVVKESARSETELTPTVTFNNLGNLLRRLHLCVCVFGSKHVRVCVCASSDI